MSIEDAWQSNPLQTSKRIQLVNQAKNPDDKSNKKPAWTRKELLEYMRS